MAHTNYNYPDRYLEGMLGSMISKVSRSGLNLSGDTIAYGRLVTHKIGTDSQEVGLPAASGETVAGITFAVYIYEKSLNAQGHVGVAPNKMIDVLTRGDIPVFTETDVDPTQPVYFRHTANGVDKDVIGRFRTDADTATCDELIGAKWLDTAKAGEIAMLGLNLI